MDSKKNLEKLELIEARISALEEKKDPNLDIKSPLIIPKIPINS